MKRRGGGEVSQRKWRSENKQVEKMREASVAAAGGRVRRVKDKECEMDQEQQEAR